jgi:integral membrane protein
VLTLFRAVALIEGITTLALFLVAMPAKYAFGYPHLVPPVGLGHGIAWLAYLATMVAAFAWYRVSVLGWARTFVAALLPFGTFLNDGYVRRLSHRKPAEAGPTEARRP